MLIYDLHIEYGFGSIGINTYKGYVDPNMNIQEGFEVNTELPEVEVSNTFPIVDDIDLSHCRAEIGQPDIFTASSMWYSEAKQYVIEYLGSKAAGGDALGAIEKGVTIGDIIEGESFPEPPEVNVVAAPKTPPKITFKMGRTDINFLLGSVKVDVSKKPVTLDYERAKVDIYMEQNPYINIEAVPRGKNIDKLA